MKYAIRSHTFKGSSESGYTYEITFNRSLSDTLRMNGMCVGLDLAAHLQEVSDSALRAWLKEHDEKFKDAPVGH